MTYTKGKTMLSTDDFEDMTLGQAVEEAKTRAESWERQVAEQIEGSAAQFAYQAQAVDAREWAAHWVSCQAA